jgi:hypothetical protein
MTALPARSPAEAELYLRMLPCERCGERDTAWEYSAQFPAGGGFGDEYRGECATCGQLRFAQFTAGGDGPAEAPSTAAGDGPPETRFGGGQPSRLLDAGQWLAVADGVWEAADEAGEASADLAGYVRDAYLEAMKFLPPGADRLPDSALFSEMGRQVAHDIPDGLTRRELAAHVDAAEAWLARLRTPAAAPDPFDDLRQAAAALRAEFLAVSVDVYPDARPVVERDTGPIGLTSASGGRPEWHLATVVVSVAAPGTGWDAAAAVDRAGRALYLRGWTAREPRQVGDGWTVVAERGELTVRVSMRTDQGILRFLGETGQYQAPAGGDE